MKNSRHDHEYNPGSRTLNTPMHDALLITIGHISGNNCHFFGGRSVIRRKTSNTKELKVSMFRRLCYILTLHTSR